VQADLDLGNYERFLDVTLTRDNNLTTGKVYQVRLMADMLSDTLHQGEQMVSTLPDHPASASQVLSKLAHMQQLPTA
jgi:CTP synthase